MPTLIAFKVTFVRQPHGVPQSWTRFYPSFAAALKDAPVAVRREFPHGQLLSVESVTDPRRPVKE